MDRFIKLKCDKKMSQNTLHSKAREKLEQIIKENKNVFVSGAPGVGKTHLIREF